MGQLFNIFGQGGHSVLPSSAGSGALDPAGIFPDNAFRIGGLQTRSVLSPQQEALLQLLSDYARNSLTAGTPQQDDLMAQLLRSTTGESRAMSERIFGEALLDPALRSYERDVAPRIAGDFASIGGTLSSRRTQTLNQGRTDVINQAQSSLAGILPAVMSYPTQQTLAQIQGLGALQQQRFTPYQQALSFALQPTRQNLDESAGPAWGTLNTAISSW